MFEESGFVSFTIGFACQLKAEITIFYPQGISQQSNEVQTPGSGKQVFTSSPFQKKCEVVINKQDRKNAGLIYSFSIFHLANSRVERNSYGVFPVVAHFIGLWPVLPSFKFPG